MFTALDGEAGLALFRRSARSLLLDVIEARRLRHLQDRARRIETGHDADRAQDGSTGSSTSSSADDYVTKPFSVRGARG